MADYVPHVTKYWCTFFMLYSAVLCPLARLPRSHRFMPRALCSSVHTRLVHVMCHRGVLGKVERQFADAKCPSVMSHMRAWCDPPERCFIRKYIVGVVAQKRIRPVRCVVSYPFASCCPCGRPSLDFPLRRTCHPMRFIADARQAVNHELH